jgi:two-component system LytT family sensor kinase
MRVFRRGHLGTESDRATFRTLHTASLASPALREGLTVASAERSIRHLRALLGTPAAALTDTSTLLAWDGSGSHHADQVPAVARTAV